MTIAFLLINLLVFTLVMYYISLFLIVLGLISGIVNAENKLEAKDWIPYRYAYRILKREDQIK
jgi:hypothetical protein